MSYNCIFLLGPTAVGKTALGVRIADALSGEIISADSRQVYRNLDIGSGKDLQDYEIGGRHIPYHLIDICDLNTEYTLFDFQEDFYRAFADISGREKLPVCVGGTGMYIDSILRRYELIPFRENPDERRELEAKSERELESILAAEKEHLHNTSEFGDKERMIKAILINRFNLSDECRRERERIRASRPRLEPVVLGMTMDRTALRENIAARLAARLDAGLIEEVISLHDAEKTNGASWARLESLGLEYRFVSRYVQGKIESREKLFELLNCAIRQFAKRQETWFRCMEKKGISIQWIPPETDPERRFEAAMGIISLFR